MSRSYVKVEQPPNLKIFYDRVLFSLSIQLGTVQQYGGSFYISLNTAANPPEGRIVISALSVLVTAIFTLLYPR